MKSLAHHHHIAITMRHIYQGESLLRKSHISIYVGMTSDVYIDETRNHKSLNKWTFRTIIGDFGILMILLLF